MNSHKSNGFAPLLAAGLVVLCWIIIQIPHLRLDPWNDELYTLQHFVLVPLGRTVTDYHVPNNHVCFSLFMNLWCRIGGIRDLPTALDSVVFLRVLPLICSAAALAVVFRIAMRLGGIRSGVLAAVLLMCSAPFYNYGCQLRGYGLSMLLIALLLQELWRPAQRYWQLAGLSAAILYTVPSNLYLVLTIAAFSALTPFDARHNRFAAPVAIIGGGMVALLAYFPVITQLQAFGAGRAAGFDPTALTATLPRVVFHFLSGRWLLLLLPAAYLAVRIYHRSWASPERLAFFAAIALVGPFILSAVLGDGAPDRVYLPVLPVLCVSWGLLSGRAIDGLRGIMRPGALWLTVVLCAFALIRAQWTGEEKAMADRLRGDRCADLYFQYYLHGYHPRQQAANFVAIYDNVIPVVNACRMDTELPKYIQLAGVAVLPSDSISAFSERRAPMYAVVDGMRLHSQATKLELPILSALSVFSTPTVVLVAWSDAKPGVRHDE